MSLSLGPAVSAHLTCTLWVMSAEQLSQLAFMPLSRAGATMGVSPAVSRALGLRLVTVMAAVRGGSCGEVRRGREGARGEGVTRAGEGGSVD